LATNSAIFLLGFESFTQKPSIKSSVFLAMICMRFTYYLGIESSLVDLNNELVLVTTNLPSATITSLLQETGKLVVFRGYGGVSNIGQLNIATLFCL